MDAISSILVQSFILGIMVLGVYISYKILDFPDMSADGSFALGGVIIAITLQAGISPFIGSLFALVAGLLAGLLTGVLHVKFRITNLLSGILVMGILYTLNLRIMGKANVPLFNENHLFTMDISPLLLSLIILTFCKILLDLFLKTGLGYTLKAVGDNPQMVTSLGIEIGKIKILGLMISNGLIAFSGCIMAQYQGFADVSMGIGTLVLGIAFIIVGESFIKRIVSLKNTSVIILGTIFYQFIIYFALNYGLEPTDLKMITSFVVIAFLALGNIQNSSECNPKFTLRRWLHAKNQKSY